MFVNVWVWVGVNCITFAAGLTVGVVVTLVRLRSRGWKP